METWFSRWDMKGDTGHNQNIIAVGEHRRTGFQDFRVNIPRKMPLSKHFFERFLTKMFFEPALKAPAIASLQASKHMLNILTWFQKVPQMHWRLVLLTSKISRSAQHLQRNSICDLSI